MGTYIVIVLDHQDGLAARLRGAAAATERLGIHLVVGELTRQVELHRRALALFAVELHVAAGLLDEAVDLRSAPARCRVRYPWS